MSCDVLAIGPHPDDVDIGIGGTVALCTAAGLDVQILDLTQGELGSRGTPEERQKEAQAAAKILGVSKRHTLGLPDGAIANAPAQRMSVVQQIRAIRPHTVLAPYVHDKHPDHDAAHYLVRDAAQLAGLAKIKTDNDRFRPARMLYYRVYGDTDYPAAVMDITSTWEQKKRAMGAHASQVYNPEYEGEATGVSSLRFWESIEARARYWGNAIGADFGEPLYSIGPIALTGLPGMESRQ